MRLGILVGVAVVSMAVAVGAWAAQKPEDLAQAAAESWLKLTDEGNGAASWDQAATFFKNAVTKEQWIHALAGVRLPLGKLISRKVKSRQYTEKLPGVPDGKYIVIQYETVFEKKAAAIETISPMRDQDGVWRVSGYFIR